ncbi:MAG: beta-N-acetylhexosaminidase [Anaerolineae bacterium]|nr:MAG: beta-N-acetylhexosaminidase [Anaerolineae bacterium]
MQIDLQNRKVRAMKLEEKIGQMLMVGFEGLQAPAYLLEWLARGHLGGIILFARNVGTPEQLAELTHSLRQASPYPLFISIDQEGGAVSRLRRGFTESPGAMALGAAGSEALAEEVAEMMGKELRAVGINWNLAPVVDMTRNIDNPSVGTRSLGSDKNLVGRLAAAQARGFARAGVIASAKHFPGLGNTPVDTHEDLAIIEDTLADLRAGDLVPFQTVINSGIASVMITHVKFPELDPQYPATLSRRIITGLLREEMAFEGVICTDCLEMSAITKYYSAAESGVRAAQAGADVILFSHTEKRQKEAFEALVAAVRSGELPEAQVEAAVQRVTALKETYAVEVTTNPALIRQPAHLAVGQKAARASIVLHKAGSLLPLGDSKVGLIEFSPNLVSQAMDATGLNLLSDVLRRKLPTLQSVILDPQNPDNLERAHQLVRECDILVVATRNAHLLPAQQQAAKQLLGEHPKTVLLCLRNPYDIQQLSASTVMCSCGDSTPSLEAIVDALLGEFMPTGKLPVAL